jgi:hypothetical protein
MAALCRKRTLRQWQEPWIAALDALLSVRHFDCWIISKVRAKGLLLRKVNC